MSIIHLVIMCTVSIVSFADGDITTTATTTVTLNDSVNIAQPHFNCNLTQHGFHLRLHCNFYDFSMDLLKSCQLHVNLPSGFFIDPFELKSNQPKLKFSIHKSNDAAAIQQKLPNSIKKLVNWFAYSKIKQKKTIDHSHENDQSLYQNNIVDIEAPEWLAQPLTFKFHISQLDQLKWGIDQLLIDSSSLDVPIHLRYHLPSSKTHYVDNDAADTVYTTEIKHPTLNCPKDNNFNHIGSQKSFSVIVPTPMLSYLVFVMPTTILLLFIGAICLLMA